VPVAAVAVEVAAVEPVSASAPAAVEEAAVEEVAAVEVLALRSPDTPIHRKVERHQPPQVLRSISYRLG
jgi:hypothetical protein